MALISLLFVVAAGYCFYRLYDRNDWKNNDTNKAQREEPNRFYGGMTSDISNPLQHNLDPPDLNFSFSNGDIY